ncbi:MAG: acetolactate synthase small subunit [Proteobacteria bacterium]|nr:acetolactate synthase small subunit [Pseudomonadota bacterium]
MKRIISILIENKSGALARVVGLFHQRGYNIETLNVGPVFDGSYSRMSVTTRGSENDVEQITKQINKIIDVIKVSDLTEGDHHEYEFILIKFKHSEKIQKILKSLNGKIHEKNQDIMVMSAWGSFSEIELAIKAMGKVNILEIARSGSIGLHEGEKVLKI